MYTFAQDVAASGGYLILCSGDHVVADKTSIVGSIGVVFQKTKLTGLIDRLDISSKKLSTQRYISPQTVDCCTRSSTPSRKPTSKTGST